jgi:hypothetical protein
MNIPFNADTIIGMTESEAKELIKNHNSDAQLYILSKNGAKISAPIHRNAIYVTIEDDFISSYIIL